MSSGDGAAGDEGTNIKVICRVRPFNSREIALDPNLKSIVFFDGPTVRVLDHERNYQEKEAFGFDHAFWSIPPSQNQFSPNAFADQEMVFQYTGAPAVDNAMQGFHNTIFAYGQTGSGKTHTMLGNDADEGIAPRLVRRLFASIREKHEAFAAEKIQCKVELSFLEIYNEKVKDLLAKAAKNDAKTAGKEAASPLNPDKEYTECRVRVHPEKGTFVEGLMRLEIVDEQQCLASIKSGMEHRAVTSTLMNNTSSRSHAIFQICLTQKMPLKGTTRVSQINLVDLAGSERIKMSGVEGQALSEAKNINQSLSTLRRVIDVLIDNSKVKKGGRMSIPPYRESLLTWVLSDSLGGNSKTLMVAAISPYVGNLEDSLGTLRYALKAKAIVCHAKVNEEKTAAVVHALRAEMDELRRQLDAKADTDKVERERIEQALQQREDEFLKMQAETKRLDELRLQYEEELKAKATELEKAQEQIQALENVEEEKMRREEELRKARQLQEETEQLLHAQEEERKKRDAELAAVLERKIDLKLRHDRAAEEEARARVAAEQGKLRQFAAAFQNAFILGKQRSGLEELKDEADALEKRVNSLESDVKEREATLAQLNSDKVVLTRKVEMLERKCQQMQAELARVMSTKHDKIAELAHEKQKLDAELESARQELQRKRDELHRVKDMFAREKDELQSQVESINAETEQLKKETDAKVQRRDHLATMLSQSESKLQGLRQTAAELEKEARTIREQNEAKQALLSDLERRRVMQEKLKEEAQLTLTRKREEIARLREEFEKVSSETESLRKSHAELREFVAHKFFPPGTTRVAGDIDVGPGLRSPSQHQAGHNTPRVGRSQSPVNAPALHGAGPRRPLSPAAGGHASPLSSQRVGRSPSPLGSAGGVGAPPPLMPSPNRIRVWQNGGYRYVDPAVAQAMADGGAGAVGGSQRRVTPSRSNATASMSGLTPRARSPSNR